jgi:hypothetical protein
MSASQAHQHHGNPLFALVQQADGGMPSASSSAPFGLGGASPAAYSRVQKKKKKENTHTRLKELTTRAHPIFRLLRCPIAHSIFLSQFQEQRQRMGLLHHHHQYQIHQAAVGAGGSGSGSGGGGGSDFPLDSNSQNPMRVRRRMISQKS